MIFKNLIFLILFSMFFSVNTYAQNLDIEKVNYTIIAQGEDSPILDMHIVCYNKYFNKDYLESGFNSKYNLLDKSLYKKMMLIEIFRTNTLDTSLDRIELVSITEEKNSILVSYNFINSDSNNESKKLAPFIIVQVPKSKKIIRFFVDGIELAGSTSKLYID